MLWDLGVRTRSESSSIRSYTSNDNRWPRGLSSPFDRPQRWVGKASFHLQHLWWNSHYVLGVFHERSHRSCWKTRHRRMAMVSLHFTLSLIILAVMQNAHRHPGYLCGPSIFYQPNGFGVCALSSTFFNPRRSCHVLKPLQLGNRNLLRWWRGARHRCCYHEW